MRSITRTKEQARTELDTSETASKRAEEALKNSEERLRVLFEFAPDAYYLNDLKGNFIDGNNAAEKMIKEGGKAPERILIADDEEVVRTLLQREESC